MAFSVGWLLAVCEVLRFRFPSLNMLNGISDLCEASIASVRSASLARAAALYYQDIFPHWIRCALHEFFRLDLDRRRAILNQIFSLILMRYNLYLALFAYGSLNLLSVFHDSFQLLLQDCWYYFVVLHIVMVLFSLSHFNLMFLPSLPHLLLPDLILVRDVSITVGNIIPLFCPCDVRTSPYWHWLGDYYSFLQLT